MNDTTLSASAFAVVPDLDPEIAAEVSALWWPISRIGEGLEELARRSGLKTDASDFAATPPPTAPFRAGEVHRWVEWAAARLGVEAEAIDATVPELPELLRGAAPAIVPFFEGRGVGFFLLLGTTRGKLRLLGPDLRVVPCQVERLRTALCWRHEAPLVPEITQLLDLANVPLARRPQVKSAMLRERLASERCDPYWMLRLPASADFGRQLARAGLPRRVAAVLAMFALVYAMEIAGWGLIGNAALNGRLDFGWFAAWLLLMLSMIPLRLTGSWLDSTFALDAGRILKSRLLAGALRMNIESVRQQGVGHLLGRVIESQALEALALSGGLSGLVGVLELGFAAWLLWIGAGGGLHLVLLGVWLAATLWVGWRYFTRLRAWTATRLDMTHDLVERMVGHRTRLAQERDARRDAVEDQTLRGYLQTSRAMDTAAVPALTGVPAGWMLLGIAGLAPAFVGGAISAASLAIGLGGVLLAQRAFSSISGSFAGLARAAVAWEQVAPLFHAGRRTAGTQPFVATAQMHDASTRSKLIDAHGLRFGYQPEQRVLDGVDLSIAHGERILLEGESGGGKSTLASLLTGLRTPLSGLLLLNGLDRHTLGDDWHRLATAAPQFNENHILSGTMGFNLLMAREWPAPESDLREAEALCEELGLGELLRRMPAGIMQRIGETGWQLSHGERSRIFLARALLHGAELTIMDESFAALDPETLAKCLQCSMRRAQTLVVIAHP